MPSVIKRSCILRVPSDLSPVASGQFERLLNAGVTDRPERIVLDCGSLERVVSNHIALLWRANTLCQEAAIDLRLLNPPLALMRVLNVLDLTHTFGFEGETEAESLHSDRDLAAANLPSEYAESARADIADIDWAIMRFVKFLNGLNVSATTALELKTIFYEVATNIRCHSGLGPIDQFSVDVRADRDAITMTFSDNGRPFDPTTVPDTLEVEEASRSKRRRGFGLIMIRRLANRLEYRHDETTGNMLTIVKEWRR
jgi:anti-sigma regulatory factor (Ser/Thr protein kinase)/anti-anti-sigma regulatory factor